MAQSIDDTVRKELGEAERSLTALQGELKLIAAKVPDSINPAKAHTAAVKVRNWLKRHAPICKLAGTSAAQAMEPALQEGLIWLDGVVTEMLAVEGALRKAAKVADMDFAKDPEGVLKAIRAVAKDAGTPPWIPSTLAKIEKDSKPDMAKKERTEALVKVMKKGEEIGGIAGGSITGLALLLVLHMIWKMLTQKSLKKPKL